jgi:hypothetical protein
MYKTKIHAHGGIRTHAPSKRSAADPRLRPRGHWGRLFVLHVSLFVTHGVARLKKAVGLIWIAGQKGWEALA